MIPVPPGPAVAGVPVAAGGPAPPSTPPAGAGSGPAQSSPPSAARGRPQTAVCVICRLEEPLAVMRRLPSGSWLCLDAGGCYRRYNTDREHEEYQGEGHPDGF